MTVKTRTKPWSNIRKLSKLTDEQRAAIDHAVQQHPTVIHMRELRKAREVTQRALAAAMEVEQPEISRLEKRTDIYINTLRRYVEGMGGQLRVVVSFEDGTEFEFDQFRDIEPPKQAPKRPLPA